MDLIGATGISPEQEELWLPAIAEAAVAFDLEAPVRLAMFLAQVGHESAGFTRVVENLNYSAAALSRVWPKRFPTPAVAAAFARQPERIANRVYGGRMGNGPETSGDGWRYRGRGLIQLTGRANYRACSSALEVDLVKEPELLATRRLAALSAGWFWKTRELSPLADAEDVAGVTRKINGGVHGLEDRTARFRRARAALVAA